MNTEKISDKLGKIIMEFLDRDGINPDGVCDYDINDYVNLLQDEGKSDVEIAQSLLRIYISRRVRVAVGKDDFSD